MAKPSMLSRLLGGGNAARAGAAAKPAGEPRTGGPAKQEATAAAPPQKAGPPYPMTPEREKLIGEALRARAQAREDLGEERVKKLEAIVKHTGGL